MKNKSLIPFWLYPYSWGLKGKARKIAEANYTLEGYELELALLEIQKDELVDNEFNKKLLQLNHRYKKISDYDFKFGILNCEVSDKNSEEFRRKTLELDYEYRKISSAEYHRSLIDFIKDDKLAQIATVELDFKEGKLNQLEYEKRIATINGQPWVTVLNMSFGGKNSLEGSFELDWNEYFVKQLIAEGYTGVTPDTIVNQWFMEVCRNVAMEEFDGTGDFSADSAANLEAVKRWSRDTPNGRKSYS